MGRLTQNAHGHDHSSHLHKNAMMFPPQSRSDPRKLWTAILSALLLASPSATRAQDDADTSGSASIHEGKVKRCMASYPRELLRTPGWEGGVQATCHVSPEGLCHKIDVQMLPGMPESVRRFAKASFEGWVFDAQRANDRPVEGQVSMRFSLHTRELFAKNFRVPAFERATRNR